jgi:outer membrane protein assembly factor BamE
METIRLQVIRTGLSLTLSFASAVRGPTHTMNARILALLLPLTLCGCFLIPNKIQVNQGNFVDQPMIDKLKHGMTRSQVRFVLGTPLVQDALHPDRWDYVYMDGKAGDVKLQQRVSVLFEQDKLVQIESAAPPPKPESSATTGKLR